MSLRHPARAGLPAMLLGLLALAGTADLAAAQAGTSCRGSGARATAPGVADSEPVVANSAADPCVTDSAESVSTTPQNGLTAVNPKADTVRSAGIVGASASVDSVSGTVGGVVPIAVGAVSSQQTVTCESGSPVAGGSSRVESLSIGGTAIPEVVGSTPVDLTVPTPAGSIRVRANQLVGTTRTGLILDLPGGAQNVYGEAIAGGDACLPLPGSGGTGGGGTGGGGTGGDTTSRVCPKGSEYVVADNLCVIRVEVAGERAQTIVVGRPFEGPSGGSVIPLSAARKRFGTKRCLSGAGPRYAIVGTSKADRITGTNGRDRILTLAGNDRADGGRGDDCLDGGKGRDILSGALGRDRVFGMTGNDSLNGGGETDRLSGGSGNDSINSAFGADVVVAGSGRDAINVATAGPRARVSCGTGRDRVRLNNREKRRTTGCEVRYVLRDR
jgi:Ca2+-binding RTX toxin-like protein